MGSNNNVRDKNERTTALLNRIDVRAPDEVYDLILDAAEHERLSLGDVLLAYFLRSIGRAKLIDVLRESKGKPGPKIERRANGKAKAVTA